MKRLTDETLAKCFETHSYVEEGAYDLSKPQPSFEEIYAKLSEYEDLEEELGIGLITLFKALHNGIFHVMTYGDGKKIKFHTKDNLCLYNNEIGYVSYKMIGATYKFSDYGKTWTLTKEELEHE